MTLIDGESTCALLPQCPLASRRLAAYPCVLPYTVPLEVINPVEEEEEEGEGVAGLDQDFPEDKGLPGAQAETQT